MVCVDSVVCKNCAGSCFALYMCVNRLQLSFVFAEIKSPLLLWCQTHNICLFECKLS